MKRTLTTLATVSALAVAASPAAALPHGESTRLNGIGGRTFEVTVSLGDTPIFQNCYSFGADGTWIDPLAGFDNTWTATKPGASTSYEATGMAATPIGVLPLTQVGTITPAAGSGVLRLDATTYLGDPSAPAIVLRSVGEEVPSESCEIVIFG